MEKSAYDFYGNYKVVSHNGENGLFTPRISKTFILNSNGVFTVDNNGKYEFGKFNFTGSKFIIDFNEKNYEFDVTYNSVTPYRKEIKIKDEKSNFDLLCGTLQR